MTTREETAMTRIDPYQVLGITDPDHATRRDIHTAYRARLKAAHPDHGGSREALEQVQAAHDLLLQWQAIADAENTPTHTSATAETAPVQRRRPWWSELNINRERVVPRRAQE